MASPTTRSFLETSPSYAQTGWALVVPKPPADIQGRRVGVLTGISGLDRLALSRYLRAQAAEVTIVPNAAEFVQGLRAGRFDVGVTERLLGGQIAAREGWSVEWAAAELPRYPVVFGLWKGDLTLKRAIVDGLENLGGLARWRGSSPAIRGRGGGPRGGGRRPPRPPRPPRGKRLGGSRNAPGAVPGGGPGGGGMIIPIAS